MLRKALLVLVAGIVFAAFPASSRAGYTLLDYQSAVNALSAFDPTIDPPPNDPSTDFAVGGFQGIDDNNVGFSAHSGPLGENPQGYLSETRPLFFPTTSATYQGRFVVTCLAALGPDAAIGIEPADNAANDQPASFVLLAHDGGLPDGLGDLEAFVPDVPPTDCTAFVAEAEFGFPIERGDILVNDALP